MPVDNFDKISNSKIYKLQMGNSFSQLWFDEVWLGKL